MPFIVLMLLISYVTGLTVHYARYAAHGNAHGRMDKDRVKAFMGAVANM